MQNICLKIEEVWDGRESSVVTTDDAVGFFEPYTCKTVSYTHLDVYKRQGKNFISSTSESEDPLTTISTEPRTGGIYSLMTIIFGRQQWKM